MSCEPAKVSKPNVLILAVTAANTDIANSEALKIAKQVKMRAVRCDSLVYS